MPYCPKCGKQVKEVENFCRACGYDLKAEVAQAERKETEVSKNVPPERVEQVKPAGWEVSFGLLALGLICGIMTLIGIFLPWGILNVGGYESISMSGWNASKLADYVGSSYPFPYVVLAGSIIMIVFALIAVFAVLNNGSKGGQRIYTQIAALGGIIAIIASICAINGIKSSHVAGVDFDIGNGVIISAIFSIVGLIGFAIADHMIWNSARKRRTIIREHKEADF
jgi:hypothetical protein